MMLYRYIREGRIPLISDSGKTIKYCDDIDTYNATSFFRKGFVFECDNTWQDDALIVLFF